jgi:hypothetical protein
MAMNPNLDRRLHESLALGGAAVAGQLDRDPPRRPFGSGAHNAAGKHADAILETD